MSSPERRILCLGDPLVDLICEQPVASFQEARAFVPRLGGVVANVAVVAARAGARVELAGGAGQDAWGAWLRGRLEREGVGLRHFRLVEGHSTGLAFVTVSAGGEAAYALYGGADKGLLGLDAKAVAAAVAQASGLFVSSNTLSGKRERTLTLAARERALQLGRPVVVDANLRLHRWPGAAEAAAATNALVPGALLVRVNEEEAGLLTGEDDVERAAHALVEAGARAVVVSLGRDGAILRGELRLDADARPVDVRSTLGAGDVLTGALVARLVLSDFYLPAAAAGLADAVAQASAACRRWGALD